LISEIKQVSVGLESGEAIYPPSKTVPSPEPLDSPEILHEMPTLHLSSAERTPSPTIETETPSVALPSPVQQSPHVVYGPRHKWHNHSQAKAVNPGGVIDRWKRPTEVITATQWVRDVILVDGTNLTPFRTGDRPVIDNMLEELDAKKLFPKEYRNSNDKSHFKSLVRGVIKSIFESKHQLSYEVDHWRVKGEWKGMGLFTTRKTNTRCIELQFGMLEKEDNAELVWSEATTSRYDSVYTCNWTGPAPKEDDGEEENEEEKWKRAQRAAENKRKKDARDAKNKKKRKNLGLGGLTQKDHFRSDDVPVKPGRIGFSAPFIIHKRLMFANHHSKAPFFFSTFTPKTPAMAIGKITGRVCPVTHSINYVAEMPARSQIFIHYDHNMTFGGEDPVESDASSDEDDGDEDLAEQAKAMGERGGWVVEEVDGKRRWREWDETDWALNAPVEVGGIDEEDGDWIPVEKKRKQTERPAKKGRRTDARARVAEESTPWKRPMTSARRL
jgi:hypothetical protein